MGAWRIAVSDRAGSPLEAPPALPPDGRIGQVDTARHRYNWLAMLIPTDPVNAFVDYPDVPVPNAPSGPLAGLTFAVKDIFDVAGYPTGCGNPVKRRESGQAKAHAPIVAALLAAGARFVGKTHTAELAFSLDGRNAHYGTPINPAAPGRVPGGSSSGSAAAVAAGLCDFALGSDTGGSVRGPGLVLRHHRPPPDLWTHRSPRHHAACRELRHGRLVRPHDGRLRARRSGCSSARTPPALRSSA